MFALDLTLMMFLFVFSSIMVVLAYAFRSQFPASAIMFFIGVFWLVIFLNSNTIILGYYVEQTDTTYNNSTDTITEQHTLTPNELQMYDPVTNEPTTIMFAFITMSLVWIMAGGLIEKDAIVQRIRR